MRFLSSGAGSPRSLPREDTDTGEGSLGSRGPPAGPPAMIQPLSSSSSPAVERNSSLGAGTLSPMPICEVPFGLSSVLYELVADIFGPTFRQATPGIVAFAAGVGCSLSVLRSLSWQRHHFRIRLSSELGRLHPQSRIMSKNGIPVRRSVSKFGPYLVAPASRNLLSVLKVGDFFRTQDTGLHFF